MSETRRQFWIVGGILALLFLLGQYPNLVTWFPLGTASRRLDALLGADIRADPARFFIGQAAIFLCALGALEAMFRALLPAEDAPAQVATDMRRPARFWRELVGVMVLGFGGSGVLQMLFRGVAVYSNAGWFNALTVVAMSLLGILGACQLLFGRPWLEASPWTGFALILRGAYVILVAPFLNGLIEAGGNVTWYYLQSLVYGGLVLTLGIELAFARPKARGDLALQRDPGRLVYLATAGLAFAFCFRQMVFLTPAYGQPSLMSLPAIPILALVALWSLRHALWALALLDCLRPPLAAPGPAAGDGVSGGGGVSGADEAARKRRKKIILIALAVVLGIPLLLFGTCLLMLANMGPIH